MKQMKRIAAIAMVGAMAVTGVTAVQYKGEAVAAAETTASVATNSPDVTVSLGEVSGDSITVTLSWENKQIDKFSYGVVYDVSSVAVSARALDGDFLEAYTAVSGAAAGGVYDIDDLSDYGCVTLGGTYATSGEAVTYNGDIATITFTKVEGAEKFGKINIVKNIDDNTKYPTAEDVVAAPAIQIVDLDEGTIEVTAKKGDVNTDEFVDTLDAIEILKYAAGMDSSVNEDTMSAADVNSDEFVDTLDAIEVLKYAAGMDSAIQ